jgi:long-chain acyl-CoA synthetase
MTTSVAVRLLSNGRPSAPALIAGSRTVSYSELRERVDAACAALLASGAQRQERIGIVCESSVLSIVGYLAALKAGLVAVPLPPHDQAMQREIISAASITRVIASERSRSHLEPWAAAAAGHVFDEGELERPARQPAEAAAIDDRSDVAALMFTSGSTGAPKGVIVTHANIAANTKDICQSVGLGSADRVLLLLPLHYCFGLSILHTHLAVGATIVLGPSLVYPERVLTRLADHHCTGFAGVPSTYQILLRKSRLVQSAFPSLRWFQQAGGRLPDACIRELLQAFPAVRLFVMYGQTEATARLSCLSPEDLPGKIGSIGRGLPSTQLSVVRPDGTLVVAGSGEIGEVVASGPSVARGYWQDPVETSRYFRDGRLYTGDLAHVDRDGFIYLVDRSRDMIKSGGNRVAAAEIEQVIAELPTVIETAVVGVPHDLLGEAIVAFVVTANASVSGSTNVLGHCRQRLPNQKVPHLVIHVPRLPHSASGKILKQPLRSQAADLWRAAPVGLDGSSFRIERKSA